MSTPKHIEYARFDREHLEGIVVFARALDWPSYTDVATAGAALSAPGAVTWVATHQRAFPGRYRCPVCGVV